MHPKILYKSCKIRENRARDTHLQGIFIPHFDQISVKISLLGVLPLHRWGWNLAWRRFHPHRCNVSPLPREKPQNWPLS